MTSADDEILPEYSLEGGVRGKYADQYARDAAAPSESGAVLEDDGIEAEAHRRYLELASGEEEGIDGDEVIAQLRARRRRS